MTDTCGFLVRFFLHINDKLCNLSIDEFFLIYYQICATFSWKIAGCYFFCKRNHQGDKYSCKENDKYWSNLFQTQTCSFWENRLATRVKLFMPRIRIQTVLEFQRLACIQFLISYPQWINNMKMRSLWEVKPVLWVVSMF